MKSIKFHNLRIGLQKIKATLFLHKHDYDTNISKSYVLQFTTKHLFEPFIVYDCGYKVWNLFLIRVGYRMEEILC